MSSRVSDAPLDSPCFPSRPLYASLDSLILSYILLHPFYLLWNPIYLPLWRALVTIDELSPLLIMLMKLSNILFLVCIERLGS